MSGCLEGILVDLGEPVIAEDQENTANVCDSITLLRDDQCERAGRVDISMVSPNRGGGPPLLEITSRANKLTSNTLLKSPPAESIDKETFDFDLPLTPITTSEMSGDSVDDEEVFFGPMGFTERCVASIVTSATKDKTNMSPLNSSEMAEIFKEANAVAGRISAVSTNTRKPVPKASLFGSRKLEMDSECIQLFDPKAVDDLLASVSGHHIDWEDRRGKDSEILTKKEQPVNNEAALPDHASERLDKLPVECLAEEDICDTPSKRHARSSTYTVDTTPHALLPKDKRKSLPMVNSTLHVPVVDTTAHVPTVDNTLHTAPVDGKVSRGLNGAGKDNKSATKLKLPVTKLAKSRTSIPGIPSLMKQGKEPENEVPKLKSRLPESKAGFGLKSLLPSKLSRLPCGPALPGTSKLTEKNKPVAMPGTSKSTEKNKPAAASVTQPAPEPRKSGLPGMRGKLPTTKLQLMRPGALQRSTLTNSQTGTAMSSTKKPGPMKAFVPTTKAELKPTEPVIPTPAKVEKKVQPKNLSSSFSTPNTSRGSSASSVDTPASSVKKRRSFLKSPKSRQSSSGSIPSPCAGRNNSVLVNSRHSSVGEPPSTPVLDNSRKRRLSSTSTQRSKYPSLDKLDDFSPSSLKPRKALVVNTPNLPRKRVSQWSPVQKHQPHDVMDAAIMCTKKMKR